MYKKLSVLMLIALSGLGAINVSKIDALTAPETRPNSTTPMTVSPSPLQSISPDTPVTQSNPQSDAKKVPPDIPDKLMVPPGNALLLKTPAKGVQIYVCQPKAGDASQFEWTLKAPEADLINEAGALIGKHYAGPTWEYKDGSKVIGEVKERADSPDPSAIPWLLLTAKTHEGNGLFSKVTYIQRVNTSSGKAPGSGCDRSSQGTSIRVKYTANYYYYTAQ